MSGEYICCFTGHRRIASEHVDTMPTVLDGVIEKLIASGVCIFRTGGAIGFDTAVALKILEKKQKYPFLRLHLFLPCKDQAQNWNDFNKEAYSYVLSAADEIVYTSDTYTKGCMHLRDRRLVEGADFCVAYCTRDSGGSAYTLEYAQKNNVRTLNIASMLEESKYN